MPISTGSSGVALVPSREEPSDGHGGPVEREDLRIGGEAAGECAGGDKNPAGVTDNARRHRCSRSWLRMASRELGSAHGLASRCASSAGERRATIGVSSLRRYCCTDTPAAAACSLRRWPTASSRSLMFRSTVRFYRIGRTGGASASPVAPTHPIVGNPRGPRPGRAVRYRRSSRHPVQGGPVRRSRAPPAQALRSIDARNARTEANARRDYTPSRSARGDRTATSRQIARDRDVARQRPRWPERT